VPTGRCDDANVHTILIVDDHADFRMRTRALLEAEGFAVIGDAADGASGIQAANDLDPDVVLLDVSLPDIDGFEVTRRLRTDGRAPTIVLISTRPVAEYGPRVARSGAAGFIAKEDLSGSAVRAVIGGS
jgi:DNA-binding NarL/FixJ family response regulator